MQSRASKVVLNIIYFSEEKEQFKSKFQLHGRNLFLLMTNLCLIHWILLITQFMISLVLLIEIFEWSISRWTLEKMLWQSISKASENDHSFNPIIFEMFLQSFWKACVFFPEIWITPEVKSCIGCQLQRRLLAEELANICTDSIFTTRFKRHWQCHRSSQVLVRKLWSGWL